MTTRGIAPRREPSPCSPSRGTRKQTDDSGAPAGKGQQGDLAGNAEKLRKQSEDALDNVRDGYSG